MSNEDDYRPGKFTVSAGEMLLGEFDFTAEETEALRLAGESMMTLRETCSSFAPRHGWRWGHLRFGEALTAVPRMIELLRGRTISPSVLDVMRIATVDFTRVVEGSQGDDVKATV